MVAFAGWFLTATVLMQQPSSLRGFINEAKEIVCGEQGLTSLDSMECKSAIVNTINGNWGSYVVYKRSAGMTLTSEKLSR